jgi:WD40 repeat protein
MDNGDIIALGFNDGNCGLYDVEKMALIRMLNGHKKNCRVGSLAWNNYILSTGSKDKMIYNHDVREKKHVFSSLKGHRNEVCQLQWSNDINCLASGGNDNLLCLWHLNGTSQSSDVDSSSSCNNVIFPRVCFTQHKAAIRALAWCPYQRNMLASGGGTKDKSIKMWNTATSTLISSYDTSSQVCNVMFNKYEKELISTHGYSKNQICIWSYPKMKKITELMGHMNRVLYMAMSPDGCTIVTGSADETLRFWTINEEDKVNDLLNKSLSDNSKSGKRSKYNDNKYKGLFSNISIR